MTSPISRRSTLRLGVVSLLSVFSGCSAISDTPTSEQSSADRSTETAMTPTEPPTSTASTTVATVATQYQFGEWHTDDDWKVTVQDIELSTTITTEDGSTHSMPTDEQLLIVTVRVKNVGSGTDEFSTHWFTALVGDTPYSEQLSISNEEAGWSIPRDDIEQVEHSRQWMASGYPVEPGETVTAWSVFQIPRNVTRQELSIGYNWNRESDGPYPVRWIP